jgi:hypothetical protein
LNVGRTSFECRGPLVGAFVNGVQPTSVSEYVLVGVFLVGVIPTRVSEYVLWEPFAAVEVRLALPSSDIEQMVCHP